jgi:hypothetical protein
VAELTRFQIPLPPGETFPAGIALQEISSDGRKLAFAAAGADGKVHLWIRALDSLDARPLPGIELSGYGLVPFFWSSDSRRIAFPVFRQKAKKSGRCGRSGPDLMGRRNHRGSAAGPANVFGTELIGWFAEVFGKLPDGIKVKPDRGRRIMADLEVFQHPLS